MDVTSTTSCRFYPSSWPLLFSARPSELPPQNTSGGNPPVGMQATLPRGHPPPSQRTPLPSHLRHQPPEATRGSSRSVPHCVIRLT